MTDDPLLARANGGCHYHPRMRLRKKMWRTPGTVYLDNQLMDKDIYVYAGSEMYVEPLDGPEPMQQPTQMQVYIRWWHPSSFTVDCTREIILSTANPDGLKAKVSPEEFSWVFLPDSSAPPPLPPATDQ